MKDTPQFQMHRIFQPTCDYRASVQVRIADALAVTEGGKADRA
jgi:hypothetical protein